MKNIQLEIIWIPSDLSSVIEEIKLFEEKMHRYYNDAYISVVLDISLPWRKQNQNKSDQKKEKKEVFYW